MAIGFAPLACIFALFSGDNCWDLARDVAHQKNPLNTMDTAAAEIEREFMRAFPWVTNIDGDDWFSTTGLWHFINVEYGDGQFNRIGGMHYTQGGWRGGALETPSGIGRLDGLDYGIIVGTDLIGLTLDPDASRGVDRYQQSPDGTINRRKSDWLKSIGHTEFEPLDNLALYGWRRFQRDGDMSGLGWVLHALGDAIAPHHGIGATGWGHRPYEDFAGFAWREMFSESGANHYFSMLDTMKEAYLWWRYIDEVQGNGNSADIDVRDLITTLAYDTRSRSDWAIKNGISLFYGDGDEDVAREEYGSEAHHARRLLETGTGATLAFLIKAAQLAPTNTTPSPCACPPGSVRNIPVSPIEEDLDPSVCNPCSLIDMHEVDGRCTPACPPDRPLLNPNNRCVAVCAQGGCTGVACPNPTDLVENGACVQQCSAAAPVIVGRECRVSCPPQMKPSESSPSFCISDPKCRTFTGTRDVLGICADSCPEGLNFISDRVCVAECPAHQPVFIMQDGLGTCETNCPESRPYRASSPEPTECLTQCPPSHPVRELLSHLCLTECSADAPFHLNGTCRSVCPQDHPLHVPGQNECVAACPDSHPHLISTACHRCPPDHNWSNGECIPIVE